MIFDRERAQSAIARVRGGTRSPKTAQAHDLAEQLAQAVELLTALEARCAAQAAALRRIERLGWYQGRKARQLAREGQQ